MNEFKQYSPVEMVNSYAKFNSVVPSLAASYAKFRSCPKIANFSVLFLPLPVPLLEFLNRGRKQWTFPSIPSRSFVVRIRNAANLGFGMRAISGFPAGAESARKFE
jgi:hypothetical protein